jgi:hypothetical protein
MGCDYYSQAYYLFSYISTEGKKETYEEPAGERESWYIGDYDSDTETRDDAMNEQIEALGLDKTKVLYNKGVWSCSEICKERLQKIMARNLDKPVYKIVKYHAIWER